jgi:hypothetical protein
MGEWSEGPAAGVARRGVASIVPCEGFEPPTSGT